MFFEAVCTALGLHSYHQDAEAPPTRLFTYCYLRMFTETPSGF